CKSFKLSSIQLSSILASKIVKLPSKRFSQLFLTTPILKLSKPNKIFIFATLKIVPAKEL
ncbi:hypothetical protein, partial [Enterococcus faecium]|uniref:hypothetical protein n=1 Tax=Enterococcus faecium TaxID=1352 RepID=UPI0030C8175A